MSVSTLAGTSRTRCSPPATALFTTTRLVELATAGLAVDIADPEDPFLACIDRDERILRRIHDHARFALDRGLNETPGAFFVFFHEDGRPFERSAPLSPSSKPRSASSWSRSPAATAELAIPRPTARSPSAA